MDVPEGGTYRIDAPGAFAVQVGENNIQINYTINNSGLTLTDGVAPAPLVSVSGSVDSPYRGLSAFGEQDAPFFFGRDQSVAEILQRMSRCLDGAGLLVVSGVSGAGKSSLLRAGMLPELRGRGLASAPGSAHWPCLLFTPAQAPLDELAVRVASLAGSDAASVRQALTADPAGFALTAAQAARAQPDGPAGGGVSSSRRLLLVVDQFEQLFTQCSDEGQRRAFIIALHAAATTGHGPDQVPAALVVLGVRADFEARCADYPQLIDAIQHRYLVTAMTERQLRLAVTGPARVAGASVDDELTEVLVQEISARRPASHPGPPGPGITGAGVLPLLSHALDQAWRKRAGDTLTLVDYERTGGIEAAVARSAERAYGGLTEVRREVAREVFTRLTATGGDGTDTAMRIGTAELTEGKDAAEAGDVRAVLEAFAAERLLTLAAGTVEISHEILLTAWPLLRDTWLADTHADRIIRARLRSTAQEWDRTSRDPSYLYRGSRLDTAVRVTTRIGAGPSYPPLSQAETDFLRASRRGAKRRTQLRRELIALLAALALALAGVAVVAQRAAVAARQADHIATDQRDVALSDLLASKSLAIGGTNATTSQREAIAAWGLDHSPQARYAMLAAAARPQTATIGGGAPVRSGAFSPDGRLMATTGAEGAVAVVRLWNLATRRQPLVFPLAGLSSDAQTDGSRLPVAFSPDSKVLAAGDADGMIWLWHATSGRLAASLSGVGHRGVASLAFSPDGTLLAVGTGDGTAELWNLTTGRQIGIGLSGDPSSGAMPVAFSPGGKLIATGTEDGTVRLWNVAGGLHSSAVLRASGPIQSLAFSPNGKLLAIDGGVVSLWNVATRQRVGKTIVSPGNVSGKPGKAIRSPGLPAVAVLQGQGLSDPVDSVAFSPDGTTLATGTLDGSVELWDVATGHQAGSTLQAGTNWVYSVAFSPDGTTLATADTDGTASLWDVTRAAGRPAKVIATSYGPVYSMAFSADGATLATGDDVDTVTMWNAATGRQQPAATIIGGDPNGVFSLAFSPDHTTMALGDATGKVTLWNAATGAQRAAPFDAGTADLVPDSGYADGLVSATAFSPHGTLLATGDRSDMVRLWDVATGAQQGKAMPASAAQGNGVLAVEFTPDGTRLATADGDGTVRLWNLATRKQADVPLPSDSSEVKSAAFSPDGGTLAFDYADGTVRIWDIPTGQQIGGTFATGTGTVDPLAFSPDGTTLATGGDDGTVKLWDVGYLADPLSHLCAQAGGLTQAEWASLVPDGPAYRGICP
jgi:WD40 repeat protein